MCSETEANIRCCENPKSASREKGVTSKQYRPSIVEKLEEYAVGELYQNEEETDVVDDTLEAMVREGARRMLAAALEEEVSSFLGRDRYGRARSSADTGTAITAVASLRWGCRP